jgi:hypothetical protein
VHGSGPSNVPDLKFRISTAGGWFQKLERELATLNDDQARARVKNSAQTLAIVRRMVLNILRLDKSRNGGIKGRRMLACTIERCREQLLGLATRGI